MDQRILLLEDTPQNIHVAKLMRGGEYKSDSELITLDHVKLCLTPDEFIESFNAGDSALDNKILTIVNILS
jgi:hypothetical protein